MCIYIATRLVTKIVGVLLQTYIAGSATTELVVVSRIIYEFLMRKIYPVEPYLKIYFKIFSDPIKCWKYMPIFGGKKPCGAFFFLEVFFTPICQVEVGCWPYTEICTKSSSHSMNKKKGFLNRIFTNFYNIGKKVRIFGASIQIFTIKSMQTNYSNNVAGTIILTSESWPYTFVVVFGYYNSH